MKKLLVVVALLSCSFSFGNDKITASKVKKVTVYLQGAQITREINIQLIPGANEILLNDLSPFIDENSIQITGLKSASILAINYKIDYLKKESNTEKIDLLLLQRKQFYKQLSLLKNKIEGFEEEETVLITNRKLGVDQQGNDLAKVKEFAIYYGQRIALIKDEIYDAKEKINELKKETALLDKQINDFKNTTGPERGELKLKLNTSLPINLKLEVSYTVSNAGWFPVYDIKAKSINTPLSFFYKAHVYQRTGTDWENARITLSTGDPSLDTNKPEVTPYYLNFINPYTHKNKAPLKKSRFKYNPLVKQVTGIVVDQDGLPLPGVSVLIKGTSNGTQTDFDGKYFIEITEGQELVFSYLGQKTKEVPIYASLMNINLEAEAQALQEVVVTAYSALQGQASGVSVRGASSIKKEKKLLYIVDGVPHDDISNIDQSQIKTIETLKGTAATSIYGSKASGGAIIITTKTVIEGENITSKEFEIKKRYTIASNNDVTAITINEFGFDADFEYFSAPLLNENVFLIAKLNKWEQFDILPGEANIYFDGNYAGKTFIDPFQTKKELTISLGVEPNIIIERKQVNNLKSTQFIGSNRIVNKAYEISIKSNQAKNIPLIVMDRIPISQNKEIKIDDILYDEDAEYDNKKRLLKWNINVSSKESIKKEFSYKVKYPKGKSINL